MGKPIGLIVFDVKDGFGVGVRSLSQGAIPALVERGTLDIPEPNAGDVRLYVRGERLKFTKTASAAEQFKERFYKQSLDDQLAQIGYRVLRVVPKEDLILIKVQYYAIWLNTKKIATTYDLKELATYKRHKQYRIELSIVKTKKVTKSDYLAWKDRITEVTAEAPGLVGMCRNVKDIQRRKVVSKDGTSDRHPGFRITTSVNFHKGK